MEYLYVIAVAVVALVLGYVLGGRRTFRGDPGPAAEQPKEYGKHHIKIHDKNTDEDYDFYENESANEDPKKPGDTGRVVGVAGDLDSAGIWRRDDNEIGGKVTLNDIDCGHTYYVTREKMIDKGADKTCGGPNAFANEYETVKDEVQLLAISVADKCKQKPSCQATIDFQSSYRSCWQNPNPARWVMTVRYQLKVTCFTL
jgi:hypothetical protein